MVSKKWHYGWVILLFSFLGLMSVQGVRLSFGAFIHPWSMEFDSSRGALSMISMLSFVVYGVSQPLFGRLIDKWGVRAVFSLNALLVGVALVLSFFVTSEWQLVLLYGVLVSIGLGGASGVAGTVAVTNWFQKRRGLALGLITSGSSVGQLLLVPASLFLIDAVGWKWTVLILGVFLIAIIFPLLLLFLRNSPAEKGIQAYGAEELTAQERSDAAMKKDGMTWRHLLTKKFLFLALPYFVCGYTTMGLMDTHLIPYAHDHGFSTPVTGAAVSLLGAFNIAGTLASGQIADRWSNKHFLAALYAARGLTILLLMVTAHPYLLFIFAALFGLTDFATVAPTSLLATDYFKRYSVGVVLGLLNLSHQLGSACGAYFTGLLYDMTGNYHIGFISGVFLLSGAALLCLLLPSPSTKASPL